MGAIAWDDAYRIGVPEIDAQHREFCNIISKLAWAVEQSYPQDLCYRLGFELLKYAEFHFVCEENLMLMHGYPGMAGQIREHKKLLEILNLKLRSLHDGTITLAALNQFAFMWFISHTTEEDKKFGDYMLERGRKAPRS